MSKPWTKGQIVVSSSALREIERAGRAAYARDEEACGYLEGPAADPLLVDRAVELENLANKYHQVDPEGHPRTGREYFKVNSRKFERAIEEGNVSERPVKVFFHSHLDCGAYFSAEDLPLGPALDLLAANLSLNVQLEDAAEGVTAFLEKRAPKWNDR